MSRAVKLDLEQSWSYITRSYTNIITSFDA